MPCIRVTASFCRQTRIHLFAGLCQHTHKNFLAAVPGKLIPFALPNLPSKPSCAVLCLWEGKAPLGIAKICSSGCQALPHTSQRARAHTQMPQGCHPWAISHPRVELLLSPQNRDSWFHPVFLSPFCWKSSYLFRSWSLSVKDSSFSLCPLPSSQLCSRPGFDLSTMLWAAFTVWSQLEDGLPKAWIHRWLSAQIVWYKKNPTT